MKEGGRVTWSGVKYHREVRSNNRQNQKGHNWMLDCFFSLQLYDSILRLDEIEKLPLKPTGKRLKSFLNAVSCAEHLI